MAAPKITDRAKRYRAQKVKLGAKKCALCGKGGKLDRMHLTGNEDHGEKENIAYGCRSCNVSLGAAFKKLKLGKPTNQYNPASKGYPTLKQYMWAVSNHTRGAHDEGGAVIHATPKHKRVEYARAILGKALATKRERFDDRWNPAKVGSGPWAVMFQGRNQAYVEKRFKTEDAARRFSERKNEMKSSPHPGSRALSMPDGFYFVEHRQDNPAGDAAEVFEDFHGFRPKEVVTVTKKVHHHEHLAALGTLVLLEVQGVDGRAHKISGFKKALLCCNEDRNQLFIEGGDQSIDLSDYKIRNPHEMETLGTVTNIGYHTNKTHLGDEGGEAVYVHRFRAVNQNGRHVVVKMTREPNLIYDVRNEQLLFSGGSYEILREGINQ